MKKAVFVSMLIALFMAMSVISFAQDPEETEGSMMGKKMKKYKMGGMQSMMKKMHSKEMVATKDGGVIVMYGKKLLKYDNLKLVKEAKIKMDTEHMKKKMMRKKGKCPMCGRAISKEEGEKKSAEQ